MHRSNRRPPLRCPAAPNVPDTPFCPVREQRSDGDAEAAGQFVAGSRLGSSAANLLGSSSQIDGPVAGSGRLVAFE